MQVHRNPEALPIFSNAVITIGTFDGVHTGHQQIIQQLKDEAHRINGETVIVTFHPHPRKIIGSASGEIKLINTLEEKTELLERSGIDHMVIVPFTEAFSRLTAQQYVQEFLVGKFHPNTVIIGYDHRFGQGRKGDYHLLEDLSLKYGYILKEIPVHVLHAISVSSTRIRTAIAKADIKAANELLGYTFFFQGTVIEGNKLGRILGYPTANLKIENHEKLIPGNGVYAVELAIWDPLSGSWREGEESFQTKNHPYRGMMNIGMRPTIGVSDLVIEVNIFDFFQDIYGQKIRVYVKSYMRPELKFDGLDALKEQLSIDKKEAEMLLKTQTP